MSEEQERLRKWISTLDVNKKDFLLLLCVSELIDSELFNFYDGYKCPTWDATGDPIDGSDRSTW